MISLLVWSCVEIVVSQIIPTSSVIPNVDVGQVPICVLATGCATQMGNKLLISATQILAVTFGNSFATIPQVMVNPSNLATLTLSPLNLGCYVDATTITTTGFTATVQRNQTVTYTAIVLQYFATTNPNIKIQQLSILATSYSSGSSSLVFNLQDTYTNTPKIIGYLTQFTFTYFLNINVGNVSQNTFSVNIGTNDFQGNMVFTAVIFGQDQNEASNQQIGSEVQWINFVPSSVNTSIKTKGLKYCINSNSNQIILGLSAFNQGTANNTQFSINGQTFSQDICAWQLNVSITAFAVVSSASVGVASISLLSCPTNGSYYLNDGYCYSCSYSCQTCDFRGCLTCLSGRQLFQQQCTCTSGYYDSGVSTCQKCSPVCLTCVGGTSNECTSCDGSMNRILNGSTCQCASGYNDNGTACLQYSCDATCLTCSGPTYQDCSSCDSSRNRELNNKQCICKSGYYISGSDCQACESSCKTCSSSGSSDCLSCYSNYKLSQGQCIQFTNASVNSTQNLSTSQNSSQSNNTSQVSNQNNQNETQTNSSQNPTNSSNEYPPVNQTNNSNQTKTQNYTQLGQYFDDEVYHEEDIWDEIQSQNYVCSTGENKFCIPCLGICESCSEVTSCTRCRQDTMIDIKIYTNGVQLFDPQNIVYLSGVFNYQECSNGRVQFQDFDQLNFQYVWKIIDSDSLAIVYTERSTLNRSEASIKIPPNTLNFSKQYEAQLMAFNTSFRSLKQILIRTIDFNWKAIIVGGDQRWGSDQVNELNLSILNQTLVGLVDNRWDHYKYQWWCLDVYNSECKDIVGKTLILNDTSYQNFKGSIFQSNIWLKFIAQVTHIQTNVNKVAIATIQIVQGYLPQVILKFDQSILLRKLNLQEELILEYFYDSPEDPDKLFYSANLIYNYQIVGVLVYKFKLVKLTVWDNFDALTPQTGDQIYFQGSVYNPKYSMPSLTNIKLQFNIPPKNCQLQLFPQNGRGAETLFTLVYKNCKSVTTLYYQFGFYKSIAELEYDQATAQFHNLILLGPPQKSNVFQCYLPYFQNQQIILWSQAQDIRGAVMNQTIQIRLKAPNKENIKNIQSWTINLRLNFLFCMSHSLLSLRSQDIIVINRYKQFLDQTNLFSLDSFQRSLYDRTNEIFSLLKLQVDFSQLQTLFEASTELLLDLDKQKQSVIQDQKSYGPSLQTLQILKQINQQSQVQYRILGNLFQHCHERSSLDAQPLTQDIDALLWRSLDVIKKTQNSDLTTMIPNQAPIQFAGKFLNITTQFLTEASVVEILSDGLRLKRLLETQDKLSNISYYTVQRLDINKNPFQNKILNPYPNQSYGMQNIQVKQNNHTNLTLNDLIDSKEINFTNTVKFEIAENNQKTLPNTTLQCLQLNESRMFSPKNCPQSYKYNQKIVCECNQLNLTTTAQQAPVLDLTQLTSSETLNKVKNFDWWQVVLVYEIGLMTLIYMIALVWGDLEDRKENQIQISVQESESSPKNKSSDTSRQQKVLEKVDRKGVYDLIQPAITTMSHDENISKMRTIRKQKSLQVLPVDDENEWSAQKASKIMGESVVASTKNQQNKQIVLPFKSQKSMSQKDKPQLSLSKYISITHPILNVITCYDKQLSRPSRATLVYFTLIQSLAIVLYFGQNLQANRTLFVMGMSSISSALLLMILKTLLSESLVFRIIGIFLFLILIIFYLYVILVIVAVLNSIDQTNVWAIQYSLSLISDQLAITPLMIFGKYKVIELILTDDQSKLSQCLLRTLFKSQELEIIFGLIQ